MAEGTWKPEPAWFELAPALVHVFTVEALPGLLLYDVFVPQLDTHEDSDWLDLLRLLALRGLFGGKDEPRPPRPPSGNGETEWEFPPRQPPSQEIPESPPAYATMLKALAAVITFIVLVFFVDILVELIIGAIAAAAAALALLLLSLAT